MKTRMIKSKKGQGTLEVTVAFIVTVLLIGAMVNIWFWANTQIINRQLSYNRGRVAAGQAEDSYTLQFPVYTPGDLNESAVVLDGR